MPRISGYHQAKEEILTKILESSPTQLDRAEVASILQVSISTAGNYLAILANEYPNALRYVRGVLLILSAMPDQALPLPARMKIKEDKLRKVSAMARKLEKNHLEHEDREATKQALALLRKEIEQI